MFKNIKKVHFVGIGGIGMSGIAEILLNQGFEISGSDKALSEVTNRLEDLGIKVFEGHSEENVHDVDVLVYSFFLGIGIVYVVNCPTVGVSGGWAGVDNA